MCVCVERERERERERESWRGGKYDEYAYGLNKSTVTCLNTYDPFVIYICVTKRQSLLFSNANQQ